MNEKDWKNLRAAAAISGGAVALHGITSKAWQWWHTFFTVLGAAAAIALLAPTIAALAR